MERLTIIKVGGKIVEEPESLQALLAKFSKIKGYKVLVHGGGRSATAMAARLGIENQMIDGRRITNAAMLDVATMVYGGLVNKQIVANLQTLGLNALGLTGADLNYMYAEKRPPHPIDYGFVGDVKEVDASILADLISKDVVPVLAPLTHDRKGGLLNTNADDIAGAAAKALAQYFHVKLMFCFEKKGVLLDEKDEDSVIALLDTKSFEDYVQKGIIHAGMIPKLHNAFDALQLGVQEVVITRADMIDQESGTLIQL